MVRGRAAKEDPMSPAGADSGAGEDAAPPFDQWFADAPMDATYGYHLPDLLDVPATQAPERFGPLWRERARSARDVAPAPELADYPMAAPGHDVQRVQFTSLGGLRLGGWVAVPKDRRARVSVVISHG